MNSKKQIRIAALGLLLLSGSNLVNRVFYHLTDFQLGCLSGIGIGMIILAMIKMKKQRASCL